MPEFDCKLRKMSEKDYLKGKEQYIEAMKKAAEPVWRAMRALEEVLNK